MLPEKLVIPEPGPICEVVVPGVPKSLFYRWAVEGEVPAVGFEVEVEVGSGVRRGWVVELMEEEQALQKFSGEQSRKAPRRQLSLFETAAATADNRLRFFKSFTSARFAFRPEQLPLFSWASSYYGYPLADVIDTAIPVAKRLQPPRKTRKRKAAAEGGLLQTHAEIVHTPSQESAIGTIHRMLEEKVFAPFLLFGVTGSGKTEVYLSAIETVLAQERTALVVVPEIALTPQLVDRFAARLQIPLGILHSRVAAGERRETWEKLARGEIRVALGARSAVFAPLPDLGLLVVDEEHESSYKQSDYLRYHARDLAVMRAKLSECSVILGSATPSFESLLNVQRKKYTLLEMPDRATTRPVPQIEIVDLTAVRKKDLPSPNISPQLHEAIAQTLEAGDQAIILYNRRGFSTYLQCETCDEVLMCPHCSLPLTFHKGRDRLLCHVCDFSQEAPRSCPFCCDPKLARRIEDEPGPKDLGALRHRGGGTERVVEEIEALFPGADIVRMDRDTVKGKESYRQILGSMHSGRADILVGTQMIAKGHDIPGVTLVGIVSADVGLHLPDFRSSERTFQLITQTAGRAGRGERPGRVLVQTYQPNHPTLVATAGGRFKAFARYGLDFRKKLGYPPFARLMRILVSAKRREHAEEAVQVVARELQRMLEEARLGAAGEEGPAAEFTILGPSVAPHERLRGRYRMHFLIKSNSARVLSDTARALRSWRAEVRGGPEFRIAVDIDPVDML